MDHDVGRNSIPLRQPSERAYVSLSEALTWIAFRHALGAEELRVAVEGNTAPFIDRESGIRRLEQAFQTLRDVVDKGTLRVRAFSSPSFAPAETRRTNTEVLTGDKLATFSQFNVTDGGLKRRPDGHPAVTWRDHKHEFSRGFKANTDKAFAEGYREVEVERASLLRAFPGRVDVPANRQLDHPAIIDRARRLKASQPTLSKGSAAASIVAELPPNPKTGKPRDPRNIERLIAPLWEGGSPESPP